MQDEPVKVNVNGKFLSVLMMVFDGKRVKIMPDLLKAGLADDPGADPLKLVFKHVFKHEYMPEFNLVLGEREVPADWLKNKVNEVDRLMDLDIPSVKYA